MQLAPGVYRLALPMYLPPVVLDHKSMVNVYVLRGKEGCLLIDSGWDTQEARDAFVRKLADIGLGLKDIRRVVYTHLHPDHFGQAGMLLESGVTWQAAHSLEIGAIGGTLARSDEEVSNSETVWFRRRGVPAEYMDELWQTLVHQYHVTRYIIPEVSLEAGDIIEFDPFRLKVYWTPGHAPGHICLYEPTAKLLFSGDQLTAKFPPHIPFYTIYGEDMNPVSWYLSSLKQLEALDAGLVLSGHEREFGSLRNRLSQLKMIVEQKKEEAFKALGGRTMTVFQVAVRMNTGLEWSKLLSTQKRGLIYDTMSYLQSLKLAGRLEIIYNDDLVLYKPRV